MTRSGSCRTWTGRLIAANPKILIGYSDTTTLLAAVRALGLVTFHGPAVMAGLSQFGDAAERLRRPRPGDAVRAGRTHTPTPTFGWYVEGYPDWRDPVERRARERTDSLTMAGGSSRASGAVTGELFGGCLEVLDWLRGTWALAGADAWTGRLLFIEPSEEKPTPLQVERMLRSLGVMGVFDRIAGFLVGRPRDHTAAERDAFEATIRGVVAGEFGRPDLPIVAGLPFGHTDPQWVLPLGVRAELDIEARVAPSRGALAQTDRRPRRPTRPGSRGPSNRRPRARPGRPARRRRRR